MIQGETTLPKIAGSVAVSVSQWGWWLVKFGNVFNCFGLLRTMAGPFSQPTSVSVLSFD